jgi:hypothetical protein
MGPPSYMRSVVDRNVVMTVFSRTLDLTVAVRQIGGLVSGLSSWRHIFDPRSGNVGFVVDKVAMGQIFLPVLPFPLSVSLHQCSILIFIYILLLTRRTNQCCLWCQGATDTYLSNQGDCALSELELFTWPPHAPVHCNPLSPSDLLQLHIIHATQVSAALRCQHVWWMSFIDTWVVGGRG